MGALIYRVRHETEYRYETAVQLSRQLIRLEPRETAWQSSLAHQLSITPEPLERISLADFFGNHLIQFDLQSPHHTLQVTVDSLVQVSPRLSQDQALHTPPWHSIRNWLQASLGSAVLDPSQYLFASPHVPITPALADYARPSFSKDRPLLDALMDFTQRIKQDFKFDPEATDVSTPVEEVLQSRRGVCQDFAHLQIACLRSLGLAARYVSGYILTHPPKGKPRMIGADASHAWVSVFCPDYGWVDVDPTNNLLVNQEHITVAWGRDFSDVSPLRGVILGGGRHDLDVRVTVMPEEEYQALLSGGAVPAQNQRLLRPNQVALEQDNADLSVP